MAIPPPPDPFDPLFETWGAGIPLVRVHSVYLSPNQFNSRPGRARFRPLALRDGSIVPTLYASPESTVLSPRLSFTMCHGRLQQKRRPYSRLIGRVHSTIVPRRDLLLVRLLGFGLGRLGVAAGDLTATGPSLYPGTVRWGQACHDHSAEPDGIVWMSRQLNSVKALMLFGDRVARTDLGPAVGQTMIPLWVGPGFDAVADAANRANIVITRPG